MKLGFVSAILPDLALKEVMDFAAETGYDCVELMCWPKGKATRRYAGVTHLNVNTLNEYDVERVRNLCKATGVSISGLGYYPNPLAANRREAGIYIDHIKKVIVAAQMLGIKVVNTFVGRNPSLSVDDNWPRFLEVWKDIVTFADAHKVRIGIENCPMLFTDDEWPGGKNLATSPAIWKRMFKDVSSRRFGLNYDPSHMIWQHMDYLAPIRKFSDKLFHIHLKDVRIDHHLLNEVGIMAPPNHWHSPKIPGLGEIDWGKFFSLLTSVGYSGAVCVEVEDRAFEGSLNRRKAALRQSLTYLRQYVPAP